MSVAWVGVGVAAAGVVSSSMSASKAAKAQGQASQDANATQLEIDNRNREDQKPWTDRGNAAGNQLQYLLGLSNTGGAPSGNSLAGQRLVDSAGGVPQYNVDLYNNNAAYKSAWDDVAKFHYDAQGRDYNQYSDGNWIEQQIRTRLGDQIAQDTQSANATTQNDPAYGSLMRDFSMDDLNNDPVYKTGLEFGLNEGTKGLNRIAAASGGLNSGALAKALTRYGNDYGSTKANESNNRFNTNKMNKFNMLSGVAGTGQAATNQVGSVSQSVGDNISQNQLGAGNARAAGYIGQANAVNGSISQGYNMYQNNQLMSKLFPQQGGVPQQAGVTGWTSQG